MEGEVLKYDHQEQLNAWTHGAGAVLTLVASPVLLLYARNIKDPALFYSALIFCITCFFVYASSTIYHALPNGSMKNTMHKVDHLSIYLLIAGTHTPFAIKFMTGEMVNYYLMSVWVLAIIGMIFKFVYFGRFRSFNLLFYLALGWMGLLLIPYLVENRVPYDVIMLLLSGGFAYSVGVLFYRWKALTYHHAIWHIFVLIGTAMHFTAIWLLFG
jgi:hemolysin III